MASNYPPGVTGNEPEITGQDELTAEELIEAAERASLEERIDKVRQAMTALYYADPGPEAARLLVALEETANALRGNLRYMQELRQAGG